MEVKLSHKFGDKVIFYCLLLQCLWLSPVMACDKSDANCTFDWPSSEIQQFTEQIKSHGYIILHMQLQTDIQQNNSIAYYWAKPGFANLVPSITSAEAVIMSGGLLLLFHGTFTTNISISSQSCYYTLPNSCKQQFITSSLLHLASADIKDSHICSCPESGDSHQTITGNCQCCQLSSSDNQLICRSVARIGQHSTTKAYSWLTIILSFASAFHLLRKLILEIHDDLDLHLDPKTKVKRSSLVFLTISHERKIFIQSIKRWIIQLLQRHPMIINIIPFIVIMLSFPPLLLQFLCYDLTIQEFIQYMHENYLILIIITVSFIAGYTLLMTSLLNGIKYETFQFLMKSFNSITKAKTVVKVNVKKYIMQQEKMLWKFISGQLKLSRPLLDLLAWIFRLILLPLVHILANFTPLTYILSMKKKLSDILTAIDKTDAQKRIISKAGYRLIAFLFINLILLAPFLQFITRFTLTVGTILASQGTYFLSLMAPFIPLLLIIRKEAKKAYQVTQKIYNLVKQSHQRLQKLLIQDSFYHSLTLQFCTKKSKISDDGSDSIEIDESQIDKKLTAFLQQQYANHISDKATDKDTSNAITISKMYIHPLINIDDHEDKAKTVNSSNGEKDCKYSLQFKVYLDGEQKVAKDVSIKLDSIFNQMEISTQNEIIHSLLTTTVFAGFGNGIIAIAEDCYNHIEKKVGKEYHHLLQFIMQHLQLIAISFIHLLGLYLYHKEAGQNPSLSSALSILLSSHTFMHGTKASIQDSKTQHHPDELIEHIDEIIIKYIFHTFNSTDITSTPDLTEMKSIETDKTKPSQVDQAANIA